MSEFDDMSDEGLPQAPIAPHSKENLELMRWRLDRLYEANISLQKKMEKDEKKFDDKIAALETYIQNRERERAQEETRKMRAAITFLGSMLVAVGGVIWSYRNIIFRGNAP